MSAARALQTAFLIGYWFLFLVMTHLSGLFWKTESMEEGTMKTLSMLGLAAPLFVYHRVSFRERFGWPVRFGVGAGGLALSVLVRYHRFREVSPFGISLALDAALVSCLVFLSLDLRGGPVEGVQQ
jgi:hypothetical protein